MYYKQAIENSPLQAYVSALFFSLACSLIRVLFNKEEPEQIAINPAIGDKWSACLQTLEGYSDQVRSVAFSCDSTRLASASGDDTIKIWDARSSECLQTLESYSYSVQPVAFSHDSTRLASASDETIKIWDLGSSKFLQTFIIGKRLQNISFDATDLCLHTDIGTIDIDALSASNITPDVTVPQNPRYRGWPLSSDKAWITYNSENRMQLPSEYRLLRSAVSGRTIGISCGSGRIQTYNFKLTTLEAYVKIAE